MKSNWITATIDDVCTVVTDGAHNSPKSVEQGHYMGSVKDFTEFGFDFSNCKQIGEEDYEKLRNQGCVPEKNDILVGKDGARYFEDIIIYKQDERPALLSSIAILRADCRKITPEFLYYTLKSPAVRKDVRDNYGSGSAIPRIVLKDFKRMPFSFPSIEEQRKITNLCSAIDAKIQINNAINSIISLCKENYVFLSEKRKAEPQFANDFVFIWLTNNTYMEGQAEAIEHPLEQPFHKDFLQKREELRNMAMEFELIFKGNVTSLYSNFLRDYESVLAVMYQYQIIIKKMEEENGKHPNTSEVLSKMFSEEEYRDRLYDALGKLKVSYDTVSQEKNDKQLRKQLALI